MGKGKVEVAYNRVRLEKFAKASKERLAKGVEKAIVSKGDGFHASSKQVASLESRLNTALSSYSGGRSADFLYRFFPCISSCSIFSSCPYKREGAPCNWKVEHYKFTKHRWKNLTPLQKLEELCLDAKSFLDNLRLRSGDQASYGIVKAMEVLGTNLDRIMKFMDREKKSVEFKLTEELDRVRERVGVSLLSENKEMLKEVQGSQPSERVGDLREPLLKKKKSSKESDVQQ